MTSVINVEKKCMHCGEKTSFDVVVSKSEFGPQDLDTRPIGSARENLNFEIERCPKCNYTAPDIAEAVPFDEGVLSSERFVEVKNSSYSYLAKNYILGSIIKESISDFKEAGILMLKACWVLDDHEIDATEERLLAADLFRKGELDQTTKLIVIDLYRRAEEFDLATELLETEEPHTLDGGLKDAYDFERMLIEQCDSDSHNINEYGEKEPGGFEDFDQYDSIDEVARKLFDPECDEYLILRLRGQATNFMQVGVISVLINGTDRVFTLLQPEGEEGTYIYELFFTDGEILSSMIMVTDDSIIDMVFTEYNRLVEETQKDS